MFEGEFVKFAHQLRPVVQKNERKQIRTYQETDIRVPCVLMCTWYVFSISMRHLLPPATHTGTFSAMG